MEKVLLKAVNKVKRITLCNIDKLAVLTYDDLKSMIRRKMSDDITTGKFDMGYMQSTTVVRICSCEDFE